MATVVKGKKVSFVGISTPIKYKTKKYVMEKLYSKAIKNPFLMDKSYQEYLDFIRAEIELLTLEEPIGNSEEELYDKLKEIGWLKEFSIVLCVTLYSIENIS